MRDNKKKRKKGSGDSYVDAMAIPGSPLWILKKVFGKDKKKD